MMRPQPDAGMIPKPRVARFASLKIAARQLIPPAIALFAIPWSIGWLVIVLQGGSFGVDFHQAFWPAAARVVHGMSPYVDPHSPIVSAGAAFVYPAPTALIFAPFGYLDRDVGTAIFTALIVLAIPTTLWLLRVRDWRVYGVVFLWAPIFGAWQTANITTVLGLGIAAAWRWRDRPRHCGIALGLVVSMKIFLWPMGLWLLATRRYLAFGYVLLFGTVLNLVSWVVLGTGEFPRYLRLVRALTDAEERHAYSVISYGLNHGLSRAAAYSLGLAIAAAVMAACVIFGRRGHDAQALVLSTAASILASPLVWLHYFALLLVPVAIARPRLSPMWGLPVAMWVCSATRPRDVPLLVAMALATAVVALVIRALARDTEESLPLSTKLDPMA